MKISESFNKYTENWPVKAACILLAVCLYIFYILTIQESRSFTVPLKIESSNGIAPASNYPTRVKITLKGKNEDIASLREGEVSAYLDLNYLSKDGVYKLPVLVNLPQQAMLLDTLEIKVTPEWVTLSVEEQISAFIPIKPLINGTPAYGYEVKNVTVKPDTVEIYGPRSMVTNCTRLQTKGISVKNAVVSFNSQVSPESPGAFLKFKNDEKLAVTVEISPITATRKFENVPVAFEGLPHDLEVYPSKINVGFTLSGKQAELEKFSPSFGTAYVNCSSITESGSYEIPLSIVTAERFKVESKTLEKIIFDVRKVKVVDELEEKINDLAASAAELNNSDINEEKSE